MASPGPLDPADSVPGDEQFDAALRPARLDDFIGQDLTKRQLSVLLEAAKRRGVSPDHILLAGPPGLGKTTLSMIVANTLGASLRVTSGPTITHAGDLASILTSLLPGDVLFIDEIHRVAKPAAEMLYLAMEDFRVDVIVGKGPGASSIPLEISPFTLVGATTRSGLLPAPLRDRFGFTANLEFYPAHELSQLVARTAAILEVNLDESALDEIARRSRGTPRIANRLVRRVRDYITVHPGMSGINAVSETLTLYDVDQAGLDRLDRSVLTTLIDSFAGGPVGLGSLALAVGEEAETIESVVEPFLVRGGFVARTTRGRVATALAYRHLGRREPHRPEGEALFDTDTL